MRARRRTLQVGERLLVDLHNVVDDAGPLGDGIKVHLEELAAVEEVGHLLAPHLEGVVVLEQAGEQAQRRVRKRQLRRGLTAAESDTEHTMSKRTTEAPQLRPRTWY